MRGRRDLIELESKSVMLLPFQAQAYSCEGNSSIFLF
jgi:hypothetical protein